MDFSGWLDDILDAVTANKKIDPSDVRRFKDTSHKLDAEEIDAIKQQNSKGFTIYDIDPNRLSRSDFFCVYTPDVLLRLAGYDNSNSGSNPVDGTTGPMGTFCVNPYWRSVYIDKPGTFLKIEFLEPRFSDVSETAYYSLGGQDNEANIWPQNSIVDTSVRPFPNLGISSSRKKIFLDFENPTANPIDVKSGDCFKTYFSGFWLTFKQLNTRIRVTIGYNSEIESREEKPTSLNLWRSPGFLENSSCHPTSFCFTQENSSLNANTLAVSRRLLIHNPSDFNTASEGLNIGWITGLQALATVTYTGGSGPYYASYFGDIDIIKVRTNSFNVITDDLERLCSVPVSSYMQHAEKFTPCEPIRFTLRPMEGIAIRYNPYTTAGVSVTFPFVYSVTGFILGSFRETQGGGVNTCPYYPSLFLKDHPYPVDLDSGKPY